MTAAAAYGKVAVLYGGRSAEREVSLMSGQAVLAALRAAGVDAHGVDAGRDVARELLDGGYARVWLALHGRGGEDGQMQGLLELLGLPYTGSGVLASALGMDKWRSKQLWLAAGLPVPACEVLRADSDFAAVAARLGLPLFVKPANEGSSIGVSKVKAAADLPAAYAAARRHDALVLAEGFCGGGEYTVPLLNSRALPVIRIQPAAEFYDYEAKYFRDDTQYHCPSGLTAAAETRMQSLALTAFETLGGHGWGRVDVLLDASGEPRLLEANTLPGMTSHSLVPMAARAAGISFEALCMAILDSSFRRAPEVRP
jgi:D-alanine-D-alanine ligase